MDLSYLNMRRALLLLAEPRLQTCHIRYLSSGTRLGRKRSMYVDECMSAKGRGSSHRIPRAGKSDGLSLLRKVLHLHFSLSLRYTRESWLHIRETLTAFHLPSLLSNYVEGIVFVLYAAPPFSRERFNELVYCFYRNILNIARARIGISLLSRGG